MASACLHASALRLRGRLAYAATSQEVELRSGLDIFHIPPPAYKDLVAVEGQVELLERLWGLAGQWEAAYSGWKDGRFRDIQVGAL